MKIKLHCPFCERCIGYSISSDNTGLTKILVKEPKRLRKTQMIHQVKCSKCKSDLFVSMEFTDQIINPEN